MNALLRVLIVEDDPRFRAMLAGMLRSLRCEPGPVGSASEAREWLASHEPDVVFLDLNMPGMDGLAFLARFRARHAATPVVILTGVGSLRSAQAAIRHRVTEFLTKPCHMGEIEAALDRARRELAASRARDAGSPPEVSGDAPDAPRTMIEIERSAILAAVRRHNGNRSAAARELGISRRTLHYRLAEYRRGGVME